MSKTTKQYCVFFEGLTPELKKSVTEICKTTLDKSKIYSNIDNAVNVISTDGDLMRSSMISETFKDHFEREINNLKNQKNNLDEILDLYKSSKKWRKDVDNDYFFKRLFRNCIKPDNYDEIESDDDIEQYLGGKSKRNKSKLKKQKGKRKTRRK